MKFYIAYATGMISTVALAAAIYITVEDVSTGILMLVLLSATMLGWALAGYWAGKMDSVPTLAERQEDANV